MILLITCNELLVRKCEQSLYSPNGLAITKRGMCNTTRIRDEYGFIHDYIRSIGEDGLSRILHAVVSSDGFSKRDVFPRPVLNPGDNPSIPDESGCEDAHAMKWINPKTNSLEVLLFYVGLHKDKNNGGRTSIIMSKSNDYYNFKKIGVIQNGGVCDKDCVPYNQNGQLYLSRRPMHGNTGWDIVISSVNLEDLTLTDKGEIKPEQDWEEARIGDGFVVDIMGLKLHGYHGVNEDKSSFTYCMGILITDSKDPSKVLYRTREPVLVPKTDIEMYGFSISHKKEIEEGSKDKHVVIPTGCSLHGSGAIIRVLYGAGDAHTKMASANLRDLLAKIMIPRNRVN